MKSGKDSYKAAGSAKTRDIGGVSAPIYGQSSKVMQIAKKNRKEATVEGRACGGRVDRPGRKAGGAAKKMKGDGDGDEC